MCLVPMLVTVAALYEFGRGDHPALYAKEVGQSYVRCGAALRGRERLPKGGAAGSGEIRAHHQRNAGIRDLLLCRRRRRRDGFDQRLRAQGRRGAVDLQGGRVRGGGSRSLEPEPTPGHGGGGGRLKKKKGGV